MPEIRGFSKGIVISPEATGSQIGISIINDDMRICSTIAEGILFDKSHDYVFKFIFTFGGAGTYHRYSPKPFCWPWSQFSGHLKLVKSELMEFLESIAYSDFPLVHWDSWVDLLKP
jgi:hypothetical protein